MPIHPDIIERYRSMLAAFDAVCEPDPGTSPSHIKWMLHELTTMTDIEKAMRWLGFIQRSLIDFGYTTVTTERDFTRPYFRR